jgi:hypothetical protein
LIRFCTYNLLCYGEGDTAADHARFERVHQVLAGIRAAAEQAGDGLVVAVQELVAAEPGQAGGIDGKTKEQAAGYRLAQLAEATGLRHEHAPGRPAVAVGNHRFHTALLWSSGIAPAGGWAAISGANLWHSLALLNLDVSAKHPIKHVSGHATPFGRHRRVDEAERVLAAMTRPDEHPPGIIGQDQNSVGADRVRHPGWVDEGGGEPDRWLFYDHDPYLTDPVSRARVSWHPDFVYQCHFTFDERGRRSWAADRGPGEILFHGGLRDTAAALEVPWAATTGYWPADDPYPPRRIDTIRVTPHLVPALTGHEVLDQPLPSPLLAGAERVDPRTASDHLPVVATYDSDAVVFDAGRGMSW